MSDQMGMMGGPVSLETETPSIVGPPVAAVPATPAPAETPPEPPPAESAEAGDEEHADVIFDTSGRKLVPLEALKQTRAELKAAKALAGEVQTLREAVARGQQTEEQVRQLQPLLMALKDRPDLVAAAMKRQPVGEVAAAPAPDAGEAVLPKAEAEDLARTLELYTPDGTPDVARARKLALVMRKTGREEALATTAPLTQNLAAGQSGTLKGQYAQVKDKAGRTVNPAILDQLWAIVPPELVASDPKVAGVLYYAAKGYAAHHGLDEPAPPSHPPLLSEPPGGGRPEAPSLTHFDQAIRKAMQVTEKAYTETGSRFKPGAINVLE